MNAGSWLTPRRLRIHGLLLAVCLWTVYAIDMSTPGLLDRNALVKGTDFLHFYTLGKIKRKIAGRIPNDGRGSILYDIRAQAELAREFVKQAPDSVYVPLYGPQISLLFSPFARLSYGWALTAWLLVNVLIYAFCCHAVWKECPYLKAQRWTVLILAIAFPGFFNLLAWGQTSGLALLCFTLAYIALRHDHYLLAGLAIGSLVFKPQLGLAAAVVFVLTREWRVVVGAVIAASAQLAVAWIHFGSRVMSEYWHALTHMSDVLPLLEPRLYQTHSLRTFWSLLLPWPRATFALYVVSAIGVLIFAVWVWRSASSLSLRFSALLFATVLVSPHLTVYDLVILAPAFLLLGDWTLEQPHQQFVPATQLLLYVCYPLFLMGPLARLTHLQLSVVAMTALLWITWRISCGPSTSVSLAVSS